MTTPVTSTASEITADPNDPSVPSAAYERMRPRWEKCRDCFAGTEKIRAGETTYLPQHSAESDDAYAVRVILAAFFNGYKRTVQASVGMLLEEPPALNDDMPSWLAALAENIDAAGTHLNVFTQKLATAGIIDSHAGIMVEHKRPDAADIDRSKASAAAVPGRQLSADDEERIGLRPYFLLFKADDVLKAVYASVNGVTTLVLLILREIVQERVGLFGLKTVTQYRVYTNTAGVIAYELWRAPDQGGRPSKTEGPSTMTNQSEIPWSPLIAGEEIAPGEYNPPLIDLADLNIQYHNSLTNHLSLQSLAYVPTPVRIGAQKNEAGEYPEIVLGPRNTIEAPHMEGVAQPIYWLSPPVDVLEPGEKTLTQTKADMASMGASFLTAETRAAETAEGKRIDSSASRATLGTVADALKDCLERAFGFAAKYRNEKGGSVTVNKDFTGAGVNTSLLQVLVGWYQADIITLEEMRYILHTGQLPEDFDPADTAALLAQADARRQLLRLEAAKRNPPPSPTPPDPVGAGAGGGQ